MPDGLEEMQFAAPNAKPECTVDELGTATAVASSRYTVTLELHSDRQSDADTTAHRN